MTDEELDAIEAKYRPGARARTLPALRDILALVAEVRRLRAQAVCNHEWRVDSRNPDKPRVVLLALSAFMVVWAVVGLTPVFNYNPPDAKQWVWVGLFALAFFCWLPLGLVRLWRWARD